MMSAEEFVLCLKEHGFKFFSGVPCSFFQAAINCVLADEKLQYCIVPNEGAALASASGAYLSGTSAVVMIQNSGLGNLINPLTSLNMIYKLPVLIFISGRAYRISDEPQHRIIGACMAGLLDSLNVVWEDLPSDIEQLSQSMDRACSYMAKELLPYVFFVPKGTIDEFEKEPINEEKYPLKRIDAIKIIAEKLTSHELVIATTGKTSRELFAVNDTESNFYMQGSMGHATSLGLGMAMNCPEKKVVVLDGDGALLMHMGAMSSVGYYKPANFFHILLDNESYETTGDQDTTSETTDFVKIAASCGYKNYDQATNEAELKIKLDHLLASKGPAFLRVKINRLPTPNVPRITTKYTSSQITERFKTSVLGK